MFSEYLLYPEAQQKLQQGGLMDRIREQRRWDIPIGYLSDEDLLWFFDGMASEGYYKDFPPDFKRNYQQSLQDVFRDRLSWKVQTPHGEEQKKAENMDILILGGYIASLALKKEEFYDYKHYGFSSWHEFVGTVGAQVMVLNESETHQGYTWESEHGGTKYTTEITGDTHADFRLFRTNSTAYPTIDPLGNVSLFRPTFSSDTAGIFSYHSVEQSLLVALIKYIDQEQIPSRIINAQGYTSFLQKISSLGLRSGYGFTAEHLDVQESEVLSAFVPYLFPMPRHGEESPRTPFILPAQNRNAYKICVGNIKELIFVEPDIQDESKETIVVKIHPEEIDQVVMGLFVQAATMLGRTNVQVLIDTLEYRFSSRFQSDLDSLRRY